MAWHCAPILRERHKFSKDVEDKGRVNLSSFTLFLTKAVMLKWITSRRKRINEQLETRRWSITDVVRSQQRRLRGIWGIALFFVIFYLLNVLRLSVTIPEPHHHYIPNLRQKPVEWTVRSKEDAFWTSINDKVQARRQAHHCQRKVDGTNLSIKSLDQLLLLQQQSAMTQEQRQQDQLKSEQKCDLPSACAWTTEIPMVAAVLVLDRWDSPSLKKSIPWRQLLVTVLQLLETVDEVWVLIAQDVWDESEKTEAGRVDQLYRARFRPPNTNQPLPSTQFHPLIVHDWSIALDQIDQASDASAIIWIETEHILSMLPSSRIISENENATAIPRWQNILPFHIQTWQNHPMVLYAMNIFDFDQPLPRCLDTITTTSRNTNLPSLARVRTETSSAQVMVDGIPYIHGLIHHRSWLCFWQHPLLVQQSWMISKTNWQNYAFAMTLWMVHLGGLHVTTDAPNDNNRMTTPPNTTLPLSNVMQDILVFFGGGALKVTDWQAWEHCTTV
jgi:hypothetical protein